MDEKYANQDVSQRGPFKLLRGSFPLLAFSTIRLLRSPQEGLHPIVIWRFVSVLFKPL